MNPPGPTVVRKRVIYEGRVQGVFFRATSAELARTRGITGTVRNRSDGGVELEAQGSPAAVESFLSAVAQRYSDYITRTSEEAAEPRADERTFEILR